MQVQVKETNSAIFIEKSYPYPTFLELSKQMAVGENVSFSLFEQGETLYTTNEIGFVKTENSDTVHDYLQTTFLKIMRANRWQFKFHLTTKRQIKKLAKRLDDEGKQAMGIQSILKVATKEKSQLSQEVLPHDVPISSQVKAHKREFNFLPFLVTGLISSLVSVCVCLILFSVFQTELHPQLQGVSPVTLSVGENFDLMKEVRTTSKYQPILVNGTVDTKQAGQYFVTYQVGRTAIVRPIKVINESPSLKGIKDIALTKGEVLDSYGGISAEDKEDGDLTKEIQLSGTVDTTKTGTYYLTYVVKDSGNQTDQKTRTIIVK